MPTLEDQVGDTADGTGPMPPVGSTDPGGLQATGVAAEIAGFGMVVGSTPGDTLESLLRLGMHPTEVMTAGLSLASFRHVSLFTAGIILIAIGILLNVASLVIRRQNYSRYVAICEREIDRRARLYAERLYRASTQGSQPSSTESNHPK